MVSSTLLISFCGSGLLVADKAVLPNFEKEFATLEHATTNAADRDGQKKSMNNVSAVVCLVPPLPHGQERRSQAG